MHVIIVNYNKISIILAKHFKMLAIGIKHHQRPITQSPCSPVVGHRALDQGVVGSIPGAAAPLIARN